MRHVVEIITRDIEAGEWPRTFVSKQKHAAILTTDIAEAWAYQSLGEASRAAKRFSNGIHLLRPAFEVEAVPVQVTVRYGIPTFNGAA